MHRAFLPKALALTVLTAGLSLAGAQQTQPAPDASAPQNTEAAHHHHHHAPNPQKEAAHLSKKLNLTSDQTARIEPVLVQRDQQMQAVWQNQQLAPQDRHEQMRTINQQAEQGMAGILSPDQMAQLKSMHHGHGHHGQSDDNGQSPS